ncbi:hypothetical protein VULLAG_LOCUS7819 [Vulpes lagopus]
MRGSRRGAGRAPAGPEPHRLRGCARASQMTHALGPSGRPCRLQCENPCFRESTDEVSPLSGKVIRHLKDFAPPEEETF